jgi:hypothetical protein
MRIFIQKSISHIQNQNGKKKSSFHVVKGTNGEVAQIIGVSNNTDPDTYHVKMDLKKINKDTGLIKSAHKVFKIKSSNILNLLKESKNKEVIKDEIKKIDIGSKKNLNKKLIVVSKDMSKEFPKKESKVVSKESPKKESKVVSKESPKKESKVVSKESKVVSKESPKKESKVVSKKSNVISKESPKKESKVVSKESPKKKSKVVSKESSKKKN